MLARMPLLVIRLMVELRPQLLRRVRKCGANQDIMLLLRYLRRRSSGETV